MKKKSWLKEDPKSHENCYRIHFSTLEKIRLFFGGCYLDKHIQKAYEKGEALMEKEFDILKILLHQRKLKAYIKKIPTYQHDSTIQLGIKKIIEVESDIDSKKEIKLNIWKSL